MSYPAAPTTFDELIQLIPPRGSTNTYRFVAADKPFELRIGRNSMNIVYLEFCAADSKTEYWPRVRRIESLTKQRDVWSLWQRFLEDPDSYLTWKYIGRVALA